MKARNRVSGKVPATSIDIPGSARDGVVRYVALVSGAGDEIGLRPCPLHDLRHYAATQALAAGVPLATVKYRLGHSQVSLTADLYGHLEAASDRAAADAVERLLRETR